MAHPAVPKAIDILIDGFEKRGNPGWAETLRVHGVGGLDILLAEIASLPDEQLVHPSVVGFIENLQGLRRDLLEMEKFL